MKMTAFFEPETVIVMLWLPALGPENVRLA